jgi:hypothetical protein
MHHRARLHKHATTGDATGGSDPPTQIEVQALRDKAEELADDVRALSTLVHALPGGAQPSGAGQPVVGESALGGDAVKAAESLCSAVDDAMAGVHRLISDDSSRAISTPAKAVCASQCQAVRRLSMHGWIAEPEAMT